MRYGHAFRRAPGAGGGDHLQKLARLKALYRGRGGRLPDDDPGWQGLDPKQIDAMLAAEMEHRRRETRRGGLPDDQEEAAKVDPDLQSTGADRIYTAKAMAAKHIEEAKALVEEGEYRDPAFKDYIRSAPKEVQDRFNATVRRVKEIKEREGTFIDLDTGVVMDESQAEYVTKGVRRVSPTSAPEARTTSPFEYTVSSRYRGQTRTQTRDIRDDWRGQWTAADEAFKDQRITREERDAVRANIQAAYKKRVTEHFPTAPGAESQEDLPDKGKEVKVGLGRLVRQPPTTSFEGLADEFEQALKDHAAGAITAEQLAVIERNMDSQIVNRRHRQRQTRFVGGDDKARADIEAAVERLVGDHIDHKMTSDPADQRAYREAWAQWNDNRMAGRKVGLPPNPPGRGRQEDNAKNELVDLIWQSHKAPSEAERTLAARKANEMIGRVATYADFEADVREVQDTLRQQGDYIYGRAPDITKGIIHSDPYPHDPRLGTTIEEAYAASGHHQGGLFEVTGPPDNRKRNIVRQLDFIRTNKKRRYKALQEGTPAWGMDSKGKVVPITHKNVNKVVRGVAPNKEYEYLLRSYDRDQSGEYMPPYFQRVDMFDTSISRSNSNQAGFATKWKIADRSPAMAYDNEGKIVRVPGVPGRIKGEQGDEQIGTPRIVDKFDNAIEYQQAPRRHIDREKNVTPQGVDEVVYVPYSGAGGNKGEPPKSFIAEDPSKKKSLYYQIVEGEQFTMSGGGPGGVPEEGQFDVNRETMVNPETGESEVFIVHGRTMGQKHLRGDGAFSDIYRPMDYSQEHSNARRLIPITQSEYNALEPSEKRKKPVPKVVQYVFENPKNLEKIPNSADQASLQMPSFTVPLPGGKGVKIGGRRFFTDTDETLEGRVVKPYVEERKEAEWTRRALKARTVQSSWERQFGPDAEVIDDPLAKQRYEPNVSLDEYARHKGFSGAEEVKTLAKAAVTAGIYSQRKAITGGIVPDKFNKAFYKLQFAPGVKQYLGWRAENNRAVDWNQEVVNVNRAYIRPWQENKTRLARMFKHPTRSPYGSSLRGVDWNSFMFSGEGSSSLHLGFGWTGFTGERTLDKNKREERRFKRHVRDAALVVDTKDRVARHRQDRGIRGAIRNWGAERMDDHEAYNDYHAWLSERYSVAKQFIEAKDELVGEDGKIVQHATGVDFRDPVSNSHVRENYVTPRQRMAALKAVADLNELEAKYDKIGPIAPRVTGPSLGSRMATRVGNTHWSDVKSVGTHPATIGIGALAVVGGGAYLYHRHQQKKKPEEERVAFYNKVLPKPISFKTPYLKPNRWYKTGNSEALQLTGWDRRKIPVSFAGGLTERNIKFRPMDRGYDPNLRIFGGRIKSGKVRGGKLRKSLTFMDHDMKKTYTQGTHDVYVAGRKLPGRFDLGKKWEKIERKSTNPNKLSIQEKEDILWAVKGTHLEEPTIRMFRNNPVPDPVADMFHNEEDVQRIFKRHGEETGLRGQVPVTMYTGDMKETTMEPRISNTESYVQGAPLTGEGPGGFVTSMHRTDDPYLEKHFRTGAADFPASSGVSMSGNREPHPLSENYFAGESPEYRTQAARDQLRDEFGIPEPPPRPTWSPPWRSGEGE